MGVKCTIYGAFLYKNMDYNNTIKAINTVDHKILKLSLSTFMAF